MSTNRVSIKDLEPEAYTAMLAMEEYSKTSTIHPKLKELIKIRASQINGCAYCIDMHTEDAIKLGESARRIFALSAWHESHLFSEKERVILNLTEEVTKISEKGVTDEAYNKAVNLFEEKIVAQIIMQIIIINAWNRIAIASKLVYKK
ncbi:MAG: carboxymuconolactone decarboxylase family protein [Bacteroidia bacterium]